MISQSDKLDDDELEGSSEIDDDIQNVKLYPIEGMTVKATS
jgi:hypothetical protein